MVYCTQCGTQFEGRYCPNCGAMAGGTAGPNPSAVPPPVQARPVPGVPSNWASVICYVAFIVGPIVFLLLAPYNRDRKIRFDAWQALFIQLAYIVANIVISQLGPIISWGLEHLLMTILHLGYLALIIVLAVKAYQSQTMVLPVVGPLAEKQK